MINYQKCESSQLVRLWKRPSRDGKRFTFVLHYLGDDGKRVQKSLGHADARKAERERVQLERELRMGIVAPSSLKLTDFLEDSVTRTRGQVQDTTLSGYKIAMQRLVESAGNIDFQKVTHQHGERCIQACLDKDNSPATANKNMRALKRLFQLAVERGQLEENPFRFVKNPKVPCQKVRVYSESECNAMLRAASQFRNDQRLPWDVFIATALCTGMRRGELLNSTWQDIDFAAETIEVSPKKDTDSTWEWHIKDHDLRTLPLTGDVLNLLVSIQAAQPEGCPYVFLPKVRYDHIQKRRREGTWTVKHGACPVNNFTRHFNAIREKAGIEDGEFHDLRRTCITGWLRSGLREYEVMRLAGHSDFETTRRFYLAVDQDVVQRARDISRGNMNLDLSHICHAP